MRSLLTKKPKPKETLLAPEECTRVVAIVEYDGTRYGGSQIQNNANTIQAEFLTMTAVFGVPDYQFQASGRTDSGVHARGQVIALNMPSSIEITKMADAMNWNLPKDIRVRKVAPCPPDFHPRFDARQRTYRYFLCGEQPLPPLMANRMGYVKRHLDFELMQGAAEILRERWDFRAWRSSICQGTRTEFQLDALTVERWSDGAPHGMDTGCFQITVSARFFLHHMVRYLVGGLARAGHGALSLTQLRKDLESKTLPDRVAPADACGLSLESVYFPPEKDPFANPNGPLHFVS